MIVAFNAGNLIEVAKNILNKYPKRTLILAGDDDKWPDEHGIIINAGRQKAEETTEITKIKCIFPNFTGVNITDRPTDWNDLHKIAGINEVKHQLEKALSKTDDFNKNLSCANEELKIKNKEQKNDLFPDIPPWHETVDICTLLNDIESLFNQVLVFPSHHEAKAIALWVIHTYCLDFSYVSPILNISSPEKRCGKSTLLGLLQLLVHKPLISSNITPAALFRSIDKWHPTLLIDEADTFMRDNEELRGVINSGHTRKLAYTLRCVGDKHEPTPFSTWCAKVIAGIGHLAETIEDRSIIIQLRRKLPHEKRKRLYDLSPSMFNEIARKCIRFKNDNGLIIENMKPNIPEVLNDRATDNWTPLFAIAQLAGNDWIKYATEAAIHLSGEKEAPTSIGIELLQDIKNIFSIKEVERLYTHELLNALYAEEEAPWSTYNRGKPLSSRQLASRLRDYKIRSKDMRLPPSHKTLKGYSLEDFREAFSCYIPTEKTLAATNATRLQGSINAASEVIEHIQVADRAGNNFINDVAHTHPQQLQKVAKENAVQPL